MKHFSNKYLAAFILLLSLTWGPRPEAQACTLWTAGGSGVRLQRLQHLLALRPRLLTLNDFIACSGDCHDGPDYSLWQCGSTSKKIRTLASWIARLPQNGAPTLYVKLANPGDPPTTHQVQLDDSFWGKGP